MELSKRIPSFLNVTFFENVLRNGVALCLLRAESVEIRKVHVKCISEKGLNFLSDLFEATVIYEIGQQNIGSDNGLENCERWKSWNCVNFIIKIEPQNAPGALEFVQRQDLFLRELKILRDVLPPIEVRLGKVGPKLWYGSDDPKVLVMEDLRDKGFRLKDRQKGLGIAHCLKAIETMARLHAGSVMLLERNPGLVESVRGGVITRDTPEHFLRMTEDSLLKLSEILQTWPDERFLRVAKKIRNLISTFRERVQNAYEYDADEFCVLNHGDWWMNNMMLRENENGQPTDLTVLDYQMSTYSSPVIDLVYFLTVCPEFELKCDKDEYFMKFYLDCLEKFMASICTRKPPTLNELYCAIHERRVYAILTGLVFYPRIVMNLEEVEDFDDNLKARGEANGSVYKNPIAVRTLEKMIPYMDKKGYFD